MRGPVVVFVMPAIFATYLPFCAAQVRPTVMPWDAPLASLWQKPKELPQADLFYGPWGRDVAPDPDAIYTLVEVKHHGVNPGLTVRDPQGRKWSVKQEPRTGERGESQSEVVLSRVLSALGYRQPPVYFLPRFTLADDWGTRLERGGRFRLAHKSLKAIGTWSWQQNPFVGMRPYQGLLATLLLFNASDLKNSNNALYEHRVGGRVEHWYVVRDLGTALGETGRIAPIRNDPAVFERSRFILGVDGGFVRFDYHGWHQELVRDRIRPDEVQWAAEWLTQLTDRQWHDAFRAGGYTPAAADRFIRKIRSNIAIAEQIEGGDRP